MQENEEQAIEAPRGGMLRKLKPGQQPHGAIYISNDQVLRTQSDIIRDWKPWTEIWPFKAGLGMLAFSAGLTGLFTLSHMRRTLQLRSQARWITFFGTVPLPGIIITILHSLTVSNPILLKDMDCPACAHSRAALIQFGFGFIQPVGLAIISTGAIAVHHKKYILPKYTEPVLLFREYGKMLRPINMTLSLLLAFNLAVAFKVTQGQMEKAPLIHERMLKHVPMHF